MKVDLYVDFWKEFFKWFIFKDQKYILKIFFHEVTTQKMWIFKRFFFFKDQLNMIFKRIFFFLIKVTSEPTFFQKNGFLNYFIFKDLLNQGPTLPGLTTLKRSIYTWIFGKNFLKDLFPRIKVFSNVYIENIFWWFFKRFLFKDRLKMIFKIIFFDL